MEEKSLIPKKESSGEKEVIPEPNNKEDLLQVVDRLEKANAERKALIEREEQLTARRLLGGQSDAGQAPPEPKPETPKEYMRRVLQIQN